MTHDPYSTMRVVEAACQLDKDARVTAERMIEKYGIKRAVEYANGYATGMYFEQTESAKAYWQCVVRIMLEIDKKKGPPIGV